MSCIEFGMAFFSVKSIQINGFFFGFFLSYYFCTCLVICIIVELNGQ